MKVISYSDGERIESVVVFDADASVCLAGLQEKGYLVISEENVLEPDCLRTSPQQEERR